MNGRPRKPRMEIIPPAGDGATNAPPAPCPGRGRSGRSAGGRALGSLLALIPGVPTLVGLFFYLMDEEAPVRHRLAIAASFFYVIYPFDAIKDFWIIHFIPIGYADDLAVLVGLIMFLGSKNLDPYRERARRWLREGR